VVARSRGCVRHHEEKLSSSVGERSAKPRSVDQMFEEVLARLRTNESIEELKRDVENMRRFAGDLSVANRRLASQLAQLEALGLSVPAGPLPQAYYGASDTGISTFTETPLPLRKTETDGMVGAPPEPPKL